MASAEHRETLGMNEVRADYKPWQDLKLEGDDEQAYNKSRNQRQQRRHFTGA